MRLAKRPHGANRHAGRWAFCTLTTGRPSGLPTPWRPARAGRRTTATTAVGQGRRLEVGGGRPGPRAADRRRAALPRPALRLARTRPASCSRCVSRWRLRPSRFPGAKTVVDQTAADYANPGTKPATFRFEPVEARYVRLVATRLRQRDPGNFGLALAEMEVLAGPKNVAEGAKVTSLDTIEASAWSHEADRRPARLPCAATSSRCRRPCSARSSPSTARSPGPRPTSPRGALRAASTAAAWATTCWPRSGPSTTSGSSTRPTT